jgi:hypothetical protein
MPALVERGIDMPLSLMIRADEMIARGSASCPLSGRSGHAL